MLDIYKIYNLELAGYKMELIMRCIEECQSENPSFELQYLLEDVKKALQVESYEEV